MSDFSEVMGHWKRLCDHTTNEHPHNMDACDYCPAREFNCGSIFEMEADTDWNKLARIVTEWAKEHPEPKYPTWKEWLIDQDIISIEYIASAPSTTPTSAQFVQIVKTQPEFYHPIPAEIAQKLGLEPKEANGDG